MHSTAPLSRTTQFGHTDRKGSAARYFLGTLKVPTICIVSSGIAARASKAVGIAIIGPPALVANSLIPAEILEPGLAPSISRGTGTVIVPGGRGR